MDLPIACTLTEAELQERRRTILDSIRELAIDATPTEAGYSYRFQASTEALARVFHLVDLERQCCRFLTFTVALEPGQPIRLDVTGPPEAKAVIADFFGG